MLEGGDEVFVAHSDDEGRTWSQPESISPSGDHFRTALGEDANGGLWVVYGRQDRIESGNFDLYGRRYDGKAWSSPHKLTSDPRPDIFHRLATDSEGRLHLAWMGFRDGPGDSLEQSDILYRRFMGDAWESEINLTNSPENDWTPAIAADAQGRAWVAWDSYSAPDGQAPNYNLYLQAVEGGRAGYATAVAETPLAEMRASVAVDGQGRVWVAWEENGVNWGKDTGYENPNHNIFLKPGGSRLVGRGTGGEIRRRTRVALMHGDRWLEPAAPIESAFGDGLRKLFESPELGVDGSGRVWVVVRHQLIAQGRWGGHMFDNYATTPTAGGWLRPILLSGATGRQDTVRAVSAGTDNQIHFGVVGDGRRLPVGLPKHHDVFALTIDAAGLPLAPPTTVARRTETSVSIAPTHPNEPADLARIRKHRFDVGGVRYRILRGDLHRHTEISMDGATDGSIWDLYRYALDSAGFDFIAITDHNYGAWLDTDEPNSENTDDEFQFWRTQKSSDVFYVPGRFVPLYGYERSVNFPLGHRNIFHARRGVFTYRVPKLHVLEKPETIEPDAKGLWRYLRETEGLGIPHTSGTVMGTDWRLRDDSVIPLTEIYQGDRNAYEEVGAPRAATHEDPGLGSAGRKPYQKGLIWNALGAGYRMGFIASSDHYSTHISYTNLITPENAVTREALQEAMRRRRAYASTDNIIVEVSAAGVMQGGEMEAAETPDIQVAIRGTGPILRAEVVKNNRVVYTWKPTGVGPADQAAFSYRDLSFGDRSMATTTEVSDWTSPETGVRARPSSNESYYYVRVVQSYSETELGKDGEVAWSSPLFIRSR